jgi:WD40 repeat protein
MITALDTNPEFVLAGMEDGAVRVYDLRRSSTKAQAVMTFDAHEKWVSQVQVNPQAQNVFLTAGYDGKVKMWDLRSTTEPLSVLKRQHASDTDKVFALAWNGGS